MAVWQQFNKFVIHLDKKPKLWEDRIAMFCAYRIQEGAQSQMIKSYVSAIKSVLKEDGYPWNNNQVLLESLIGACKFQNDSVKCRLPIRIGLLEILLFELQRKFSGQPHLECLYKAILIIMYYGMMRIGEVTSGTHTVKAKDIHIGRNKNKIMLVLYSSKTHGKESLPQKIKIAEKTEAPVGKFFFCLFELIWEYADQRGNFDDEFEQFFIFPSGVPVKPSHVHTVLRNLLAEIGLDPLLYNTHSLHAGHAVDMFKSNKFTLEEIKSKGRWKSSVVYKYLRQ